MAADTSDRPDPVASIQWTISTYLHTKFKLKFDSGSESELESELELVQGVLMGIQAVVSCHHGDAHWW